MDEMYGPLADLLNWAEHHYEFIQFENAEVQEVAGEETCVLVMMNGEPIRITMERI